MRAVLILGLAVAGACADGTRSCPSTGRYCPELPSQMTPGEIAVVLVSFDPGPGAVESITASVAARNGRFDVFKVYESWDALEAKVDRRGAEVLCAHGLVQSAGTPELYCLQ